VASGMARFIDRSSSAVIKATTPFGYAVGEPGAAFDVYVGDESVEVIAIRGKVDFIHDVDGARYDVVPDSMSILADNRQATGGDGKVDAEWDEWNASRDTVLVQSLETKGESVQYLPEGIREDAQVLDENGRWEQVYYQGQYRRVWRPTHVAADWTPYSVGRWTEWYGDYTWIPEEPFGYTTCHYGYWFWGGNYWYWAPPAVSVGVGGPFWGIGFSWYPGRVGWLSSGVTVGWFPLLPWEPYYASHWWGPGGFAVHNASVININVNRYAFANRAVFVNQGSFTTVNNLSTVRQSVNTANLSTFRGAPLASGALGTAATSNSRFRFTSANPSTIPSQGVTSRVAQNQTRFSQAATGVSAGGIRQQVATTSATTPGTAQVAAPRLSSAAAQTGAGAGAQGRALNQNPRAPSTSSVNAAMSAGRGGTGTAQGNASVQSRTGPATATPAQSGATGSTGRTSAMSRTRQGTSSGSARTATGATGPNRGTSTSGRASIQSGRSHATQGSASAGSSRSHAGSTGLSRGSASNRSLQGQGRAAQSLGRQSHNGGRTTTQFGGSRGTPGSSQGRAVTNPGRSRGPAPSGHPGGGFGGAPHSGGGHPGGGQPSGGGHGGGHQG
jgi:hypothetical protein